MDTQSTLLALAALGQETRLEAFRLLVAHEPGGLAAGDVSRRLDVPQNTMSAHLAILARSGLVMGARDGRSIVYRADLAQVRALMLFLIQNCCEGRAELCAPLVAALEPCS